MSIKYNNNNPALPTACAALKALIKVIIVLIPRDRLNSHRIPSPPIPATEPLTSATNHKPKFNMN